MAGEIVPVHSTNHTENPSHSSHSHSALIDQWHVQFARFLNFADAEQLCTHPLLTPLPAVTKKRMGGGTWISSAGDFVSLKLFPHGSRDAIIVASLGSNILEEHYISKLNFSWPQMMCVSGFPARGSRAVLVSYVDGAGQVQKFALRFPTNFESEKFMSILKEIFENGELPWTQVSSQADYAPSHEPTSELNKDIRPMTSVDTETLQIAPDLRADASQGSNPERGSQSSEAEKMLSSFPPSFTSFLVNCLPATTEERPTEPVKVDPKIQLMQYLRGSSFQDILAIVEDVVDEFGDDILL